MCSEVFNPCFLSTDFQFQQEGVKIFILLYKEMSVAVNLQSIYSKHTLVNKCPENIKVAAT